MTSKMIKKLFRFKKTYKTFELRRYRGEDDPTITELVIPEKYRFRPVVEITWWSFKNCKYLQKVYIPDSVQYITSEAFVECDELREIRLPPKFTSGTGAFLKCPKLNPETVLKGCIGDGNNLLWPLSPVGDPEWDELLRPDVFELAIKYDSFRLFGDERLFEELVLRGAVACLAILEQAGRTPSAEQTDALIRLSIENKTTEMTAYLLDYKNRKFGFNGGVNFEL